MTPSDIIHNINSSSWNDYALESMDIDFDKVVLCITDETNSLVRIECNSYIGFSRFGHWDDWIIESIKVYKNSENCTRQLLEIKNHYGSKPLLGGGGYRSYISDWYEFVIKFIDDSILNVICSEININESYNNIMK